MTRYRLYIVTCTPVLLDFGQMFVRDAWEYDDDDDDENDATDDNNMSPHDGGQLCAVWRIYLAFTHQTEIQPTALERSRNICDVTRTRTPVSLDTSRRGMSIVLRDFGPINY